jgi:hypothetical protein
LKTFPAGLLLAFPLCSLAQSPDVASTKGTNIRFHVTSVSYADDPGWCPTANCYGKKFPVDGFVGSCTGTRTAYRLTCDDVQTMKPRPVLKVSCGSVHANNDYDAKLFPAGINFWPIVTYSPPPTMPSATLCLSRKLVSLGLRQDEQLRTDSECG